MFTEKINPYCEALKLEGFEGFEEKFITITLSLKITGIFCQIENKQDLTLYPNKQGSLRVEAILVPGGHISLVQSSLYEWKSILTSDLNDYIHERSDFLTAQQSLRIWRKICREGYKENNPWDRLNYGKIIKFKCCFENRWINKDFGELVLNKDSHWEMLEHFEARKAFYADMEEILEEAYERLTELQNLGLKSYEWISDHPELEMAELIDAIEKARLKINPDKGGDPVKFRHQLYSLFGVNGKLHAQKLQHLRKRKDGVSVFEILSGASYNKKNATEQKSELATP